MFWRLVRDSECRSVLAPENPCLLSISVHSHCVLLIRQDVAQSAVDFDIKLICSLVAQFAQGLTDELKHYKNTIVSVYVIISLEVKRY